MARGLLGAGAQVRQGFVVLADREIGQGPAAGADVLAVGQGCKLVEEPSGIFGIAGAAPGITHVEEVDRRPIFAEQLLGQFELVPGCIDVPAGDLGEREPAVVKRNRREHRDRTAKRGCGFVVAAGVVQHDAEIPGRRPIRRVQTLCVLGTLDREIRIVRPRQAPDDAGLEDAPGRCFERAQRVTAGLGPVPAKSGEDSKRCERIAVFGIDLEGRGILANQRAELTRVPCDADRRVDQFGAVHARLGAERERKLGIEPDRTVE